MQIKTHHKIGLIIFLVSTLLMHQLFSVKCKDCADRTVNPLYQKMMDEAETGDVLLTNSNDFFSRMIRDVEPCDFAGAKIIYKYPGEAGIRLLLISDANDLMDDKHGLRFEPMDEYFQDYQDVKIGLFRPLKKTSKALETIESMVQKASDEEHSTPYDFSFDNDNMDKLTCSKLLMLTYDDYLLDRTLEKARKYISTTLPCDIKKENLKQIGTWINYWNDGE